MKPVLAAAVFLLTAACTAAGADQMDMNMAQAAALGSAGVSAQASTIDEDIGISITDREGNRIPEIVLVDPPRDKANPARNRQLVIPSGPVRPELGRPAEMNALFFLAAGEGPKPTMVLLHGLPGNERNLDLAQAVRRAGWNVLTFTYRGAWGSEGVFSIRHAMDDAAAALVFLRKPESARTYGIDTNRIVVAGHSMGGAAAAVVGALDPGVAGLILLDAWNIAATARDVRAKGAAGRAGFIAGFDDLGHSLGPVSAADLADEVARRGEEWDLRQLAHPLARKRVLIVYAEYGGAKENRLLADEIGKACPLRGNSPSCGGRLTVKMLASDHSFADHRIALAAEVVDWLGKLAPR